MRQEEYISAFRLIYSSCQIIIVITKIGGSWCEKVYFINFSYHLYSDVFFLVNISNEAADGIRHTVDSTHPLNLIIYYPSQWAILPVWNSIPENI